MLTFTVPPSRSSVAILRDLTQNSQHYLQNAPSTQEIAHKDQYTSHLKEISAKTRLQQLFLLTNFGATWFMIVLHRAPLALDTYMLVYFHILWHKLVIVWLLMPHGKYWHCVMSKHSGLWPSCFDATQCQYLPCGTHNHTITNTKNPPFNSYILGARSGSPQVCRLEWQGWQFRTVQVQDFGAASGQSYKSGTNVCR